MFLKRAMKACKENRHVASEHFVQSYKEIAGGKGAKQDVKEGPQLPLFAPEDTPSEEE